MARKTVMVCDNCGNEIEARKGARVRLIFEDSRRGEKQADFCDTCAAKAPGRPTARRGRKPAVASA